MNQDRETFEAWARGPAGYVDDQLSTYADGSYQDSTTRLHWRIWQAACKATRGVAASEGQQCLSRDGAPNHCVLWKCHEAKTCARADGVAASHPAEPHSLVGFLEKLRPLTDYGRPGTRDTEQAELRRALDSALVLARALTSPLGVALPDGAQHE